MNDFLAVLFNGPLLPSDAIAVLSGDGKVRLETAIGALKQRAAHTCVVLGGLDNPPHSLPTSVMRDYMVENGLAADRIITGDGRNTHEQAEVLAQIIKDHEWGRVLLVTSPYHMPRAFLTVLKSIDAFRENVEVIPLPAQCDWWSSPEGLKQRRIDLFGQDVMKIAEYGDHVASYAEGLAYLRHWE